MISACIVVPSSIFACYAAHIVPHKQIGEHAFRMLNSPNTPRAPASSIRLAHLSDPHLSSLEDIGWRQLLSKRVLGYLSWRLRRRREHRPEVLERLERDLAEVAPDHIVVTGDLTHIGLPQECRQALAWLQRLGSPSKVSLIPGNHDCYAPAEWSGTVGLWKAYMQGDATPAVTHEFPWLRRRGALAIVGLNSALPTAPFLATGRLGDTQIGALDRLLDSMRSECAFRIVLLHHPPVDGVTTHRRRLVDAAPLRNVLARHGAELVLHGHAHRWVRSTLPTGDVRVPVFGIPSASALSPDPARRAGYNVFDITRHASDWEIQLTQRRLDPAGQAFAISAQESFRIPIVQTA
jgi:3',5'-cyclic AMP phosphodiesterase CpdA